MSKPKATDWKARNLADWNVATFIAWLTDENKRRFNADYVPFGKGPISARWAQERGQLKNAQRMYGNTVLHRFIERCLDAHRPKPSYPHINFGFMFAYMRDEVPRAQADVAAEQAQEERRQQAMEVDADDMLDLL